MVSSDNGRGPGPGPGKVRALGGARRSNHMPSGQGSGGERDEWLSADYRRRRGPLRTPVNPMRPKRAPEQAIPAYGWYGALQDEVLEEDMEWDIDRADGDPMEDLGSHPTPGRATGGRQPGPPVPCGGRLHGRHCREDLGGTAVGTAGDADGNLDRPRRLTYARRRAANFLTIARVEDFG